MTEQHERRISHSELTLLAFKCKRCAAEVTLDIRSEEQCRRMFDPQAYPLHCPFCDAEFDRYFRESFRLFGEWRQKLEASGQEIVFRLQDVHPTK